MRAERTAVRTTHHTTGITAGSSTTGNPATARAGFIAAVINTLLGISYFLVILFSIVTGAFVFPPPQWLQLFGGVVSLLACPPMVVMMVALHEQTPPAKRIWSLSALGFTLLFALSVSMNRFSQLGVVRQAQAGGQIDGIHWFEAYNGTSVLFSMEYLGWAWFLGLAMLCAAPIFSGGRLHNSLRWSMVLYGALGLLASLGFLLPIPWMMMLGFPAWGLVLYIITGLLAVYFRRTGD